MAYKRRFYLVDTENTGTHWISAIPPLRGNDQIILFYTEKSANYRSAEVEQIMQYQGHLTWIPCWNGSSNALDFQLVSWLGYQVKSAPKTEYLIVSDDHGYDAVCRFWSGKDISVSRMGVAGADLRTPAHSLTDVPEVYLDRKTELILKMDKAGIPKAARPVMNTLMKTKYKSVQNFRLAYDAILSGKEKEIYQAIDMIAGGSDDVEAMRKCWVGSINSIQKRASA